MKTLKQEQNKTGNGHVSDASTTHYMRDSQEKSIVTLTIDKKKYIMLSKFAEVKGITEWYARKLCRLGKVDCIRVGNYWFIHK